MRPILAQMVKPIMRFIIQTMVTMVFRKRKERTDRLLNELHLGEFWLMPGAFRAEEATAGMMGSYGLPGGYGALAASAEQEEALRPFHTIVQPLWKRSVPGYLWR